jgi:hypothetical protein
MTGKGRKPNFGALVQGLRTQGDTNAEGKHCISFILKKKLAHFDSQPICLQVMILSDCAVVVSPQTQV